VSAYNDGSTCSQQECCCDGTKNDANPQALTLQECEPKGNRFDLRITYFAAWSRAQFSGT